MRVDAKTGQRLNRATHEPNAACSQVHCYSHGRDERSLPCYQSCWECGHVYPSALSLWRAYQRIRWSMVRAEWRAWRARPADVAATVVGDLWGPRPPNRPVAETGDALRSLLRSPARITFCQACTHDF